MAHSSVSRVAFWACMTNRTTKPASRQIPQGTLYPMLHGLEKGLLASEKRVIEGKVRKYYHLTPAGEEALNPGREKAIELLDEIWDEPIRRSDSAIPG